MYMGPKGLMPHGLQITLSPAILMNKPGNDTNQTSKVYTPHSQVNTSSASSSMGLRVAHILKPNPRLYHYQTVISYRQLHCILSSTLKYRIDWYAAFRRIEVPIQ